MMSLLNPRSPVDRGFTLLELMCALVVIGILLTMVVAIADVMRTSAEKVQCMANLRGLYGGASSFLLEQGRWPQVNPRLLTGDRKEYARQWIAALKPYGISQQNWLCPTQHRSLGGPDMTKKESVRVDYNATPFDDRPNTARLWPTQPWFVEHASVHDGGPLLIYTNGHVVSLEEAVRNRSSPR